MSECKCFAYTTEDGRHKTLELLENEKIWLAAAPFGLSERIQDPEKMIVRIPEYKREGVRTKSNSNLHAKLIITHNFVIHGSCNFTDNSLNNEHEIMHVTYHKCCPEKAGAYTNFFLKLWKRSTNN